jgi:RNA recognition motif-containing protein
LFEPYGPIKEIIVKTKQGSSNSYCFIEYHDVEPAVKAQEEYACDYQGSKAKTLKENN